MSTNLFRYDIDARGRHAAHPIAGAHAGLARFLTEEVASADYADLLLDCVHEARRSGKPQVNTGNAYAAAFDANDVRIEHLHVKGHAVVTVPLALFEQAITEWRAFLSRA